MMALFHKIRMMSWGGALMTSAIMLCTAAAVAQGTAALQEPALTESAPQVTPVKASPAEQAEYQQRRGEQLLIALDNTYQHKTRLGNPGVKPEEVGSIVLTVWEHMLIEEWRAGATVRIPVPEEGEAHSGPTGLRELSLGGIVYANNSDWTIWLNGQRLKPDALPREVMDINVRKKYIELKWYDSSTNLIYPIRLRPHQRFNLDSRIFLPGTPAETAAAAN